MIKIIDNKSKFIKHYTNNRGPTKKLVLISLYVLSVKPSPSLVCKPVGNQVNLFIPDLCLRQSGTGLMNGSELFMGASSMKNENEG